MVKIRLQLQTHSLSDPLTHTDLRGSPIYKGTLPTIKRIVRDEGVRALWKGNVPAEILYVAYGAIQFVTINSVSAGLRTAFGDNTIPLAAEKFIGGAVAGAAATTATYPLDLLRTRFAAQGNEKIYKSLLSSIQHIAYHEGPKGFYQGLGAGVGQIMPYMGIYFAAYETLRIPVRNMELPFGLGDAAAGVTASIIAKTSVFPLDLIRKRLQVQGPSRGKYVHRNIPLYNKGVFGTFTRILAFEGPRGLYRGLTVR